MSDSLGLSIGAANLVAARTGGAPVARSAVLTLFEHRATEIGLPEENPSLSEPGLVLRGFVERVGDPAPLVAADGTKYLGEVLTVEAIEAMARTVGYGTPVTVAVPAYWSQAQTTALREEFFAQRDLTRGGVAPALVSDAVAAVAALRTGQGFPTGGVVAVCDFGASGSSLTLIDAGNSRQIGPSVRDTALSGDAIDQLVLDHVRAASDAETRDAASTTRIGAASRLLGECRRAKERLSTATAATVAADSGGQVRLARLELEQLIAPPLERFLDRVDDTLRRNAIQQPGLTAVATVGGGAAIPLINTRLSERLRVPVHAAPRPAFAAALGAAVLGQQQGAAAVATAASPVVENPTEAVETSRVSGSDQALAWSQDADDAGEPVPYTGPDMTGEYRREPAGIGPARRDADIAPLPWYKRTALVLSVVGAAAAVLVAVVLALTLGHTKTSPANTTPPGQPGPPPTSETVTITGPDNSTTVTVVPPPSSSQPPAPTTTSEAPTTTTTTSQAPTTTAATTTAAPTTTSQATTTAAPTTRSRPLPLFPPQPPRP